MLLNTDSNLNSRRSFLLRLYYFWDLLVVLLCFWLAINLTSPTKEWIMIGKLLKDNLLFIAILFIIWHLTFSNFNLYGSKRLSFGLDFIGMFKATVVGTAFIVVLAELFVPEIVTSKFIIVFWFLATLFVLLTRAFLSAFLKLSRKQNRNLRNIIIVGHRHRGQLIAKLLREHPEVGYRVLGFVDNISNKDEPEILGNGHESLGSLEEFPDLLSETTVDEVFIALPIKSYYEKIDTIVNQCKEQGIPVRLSSDFFHLEEVKTKFGYLGTTPIMTLYNGMEESLEMTVKRIIDILVSVVLLLGLLPLLLLVALFIKISSQGPVFFSQKRIGLHKREFDLYKFRTMVTNAEVIQHELESLNEASGPVFKINNDPRVTKIGKILRRLSIDELPQLFNVLVGDMSLVGPRPLPVRDFDKFDENWTRRRFSVRPGITCIWQTSGRSDISFEQWMKLDLKYIDNWSLLLDIKILTKTIPAVIKGSGAY